MVIIEMVNIKKIVNAVIFFCQKNTLVSLFDLRHQGLVGFLEIGRINLINVDLLLYKDIFCSAMSQHLQIQIVTSYHFRPTNVVIKLLSHTRPSILLETNSITSIFNFEGDFQLSSFGKNMFYTFARLMNKQTFNFPECRWCSLYVGINANDFRPWLHDNISFLACVLYRLGYVLWKHEFSF